MSASPPEKSAEQGDATPDNNSESMDRGEEAQAREAYDFEVKEQDRWLPIANGWLHAILSCTILVLWIAHFRLATLHDDGTPVLPSLIGSRTRNSCSLPSPQAQDLPQHHIT